MTDKPDQGGQIPRATFSHIIHRAALLEDRRANSIDEDELYAIARELGITEAAVAEAFQEVVAGQARRAQSWWRIQVVFRRWAIPAGVCGLIGSAAMLVMKDGIPLGGWFPFLVPLLFAVLGRRKKRHKEFQIQNAAYWLGLTATWLLLLGHAPGDLIRMITVPMGLTAAAGAVLIGVRRPGSAKGFGGISVTRSKHHTQGSQDAGRAVMRVGTGSRLGDQDRPGELLARRTHGRYLYVDALVRES